MKKSILVSFMLLASFAFLSAQQQKAATNPQFTKTQLFAFKDVNSLLSAVNQGEDYSQYLMRSFNLRVTATITNPDGTITSISANEMEPCGAWGKKQIAMIEKYAGTAGAVFTLEAITLVEPGKPGTPYVPETPFSIPNVSFSIK